MLIMALIRNGHSRVYEYGYSQLMAARDELELHTKEDLINKAYAHRISQTTDEKWKKFVTDNSPKEAPGTNAAKKPKKQMTKEDHMRVIRRLKGIG